MDAIRVTFGEIPPLLRSVVEGMLHDDPEVRLVEAAASATGAIDIPDDVDVILVAENALKGIVPLPLADSGPADLRLVAISAHGSDAAVVRLIAHRQSLDQGRRQALSKAIRAAAGIAREIG
jgi:hypothetical protein